MLPEQQQRGQQRRPAPPPAPACTPLVMKTLPLPKIERSLLSRLEHRGWHAEDAAAIFVPLHCPFRPPPQPLQLLLDVITSGILLAAGETERKSLRPWLRAFRRPLFLTPGLPAGSKILVGLLKTLHEWDGDGRVGSVTRFFCTREK